MRIPILIVWCGLMLFAGPAFTQRIVPAPVASIVDPAQLPAHGRQTTYIEAPTAGRYAMSVQSKTGVALELIDYMSGPVASDGVPGQQDGRIDAFLDQGRYKLILRGAPQAQGDVTVTARLFAELQPTPRRLPLLELIAGELDDVQQRSYWLEIQERGPVFLEAGGRFLNALHLWRDGLTRLESPTARRTLEPQPGQPLTTLTLDTVLDPGFYRVTLYGGPELAPWTRQSEEKPFYLRLGVPRIEGATRQWRAIGPLGMDRFIVATPASDYGRLELPVAAAVRGETADIERGGIQRPRGMAFAFTPKTRWPVWEETHFDSNSDRLITIQGRQGQGYVWQNFKRAWADPPQTGGEYWVNLISAGDERDHPPLTAVLAWRQTPHDANRPNWRILASNAPRFGKDSTWRGRFNLLGPTELLIEITVAGEFEIQTQGVALTATLKPLLATENPNIRPRGGPRWTLEAGFYRLELTPDPDKRGIVDVRFQSANLAAGAGNPVTISPARFPSLQAPGATRLFFNQRPQIPVGLLQRSVPLSLREPLFVPLAAAESLDLAIAMPGKGVLTAWDEQGQPQAVAVDGGPAAPRINVGAGLRKVRLTAPAESGAALSLQWQPDPVSPAPLPASLGQAPQQPPPVLLEEQPLPLELVAERDQSVAIEVREPGLFRLETTGRLRTQGRLSTHLVPRITQTEANGVGHNFLIQNYLRAGRYLLGVGSRQGTAGHARLLLRRAPLRDGGPLSFETPARVTLAAGEGAVYRFTVPPPGGAYRLQAIGLAQDYPIRLEDGDGWPVLPSGQAGSLSAELPAGDYRLVILPTNVTGRVLVSVAPPPMESTALQGHGPHPLPLNSRQAYRWLEPAREGETRAPDQWEFTLTGETDLRLDITEGMRGELQRLDGAESWRSVAHFSDRKSYRGRAPPGRYRVLTEALGRNNQLDYTLNAWTRQLLPDQPRRLDRLPARIPVSVGRDQVVEITSLGRRDTRATLRDAAGHVLARGDDRADGWDFLVSRQLKAGHYELTVEEIHFQKGEGESEVETDESETVGDAESSTETVNVDEPEASPTVRDGGRNGWIDEREIWVALRLPGEAPAPILPPNGDVALADGNARVFPLTGTDATGCQLFAARSPGELTLALEAQQPDGGWRVLDTASGRSAWLALLPPPRGPAHRLRVWGNDGGKSPILLQSRALNAKPQPLDQAVVWERIAGIEPPLGMARVELPTAQAVRLPLADPTLRGGSLPGDVLQAASDEILIPQSRQLWLLKPVLSDEPLNLAPVGRAERATVQLTVPAGRVARLPAAASHQDQLMFWRVESRLGQPGIEIGNGMGVAANSAVAAGSAGEIKLWNAGAPDAPLPVVLHRHDLRMAAAETADFGVGGARLAPREARLFRLPAGHKRLRLDLPARTAVISGWDHPAPRTLWTGDRALSYGLDLEAATLLLANLGENPAPVSWSLAPLTAQQTPRLTPGVLFRRFEPTAGVLLLQAQGRAGLELMIQGQEAVATVLNADGSVRRGTRIALEDSAQVLLQHGPGLLAAGLAGNGSDPWPQVLAQPIQVPSVLTLRGSAQALRVEFDHPVLLHGRGSTPLLAGVRRDGQAASPLLHPQGARFAHYLPPGQSELLLLPPQEGELAGVLELQASDVQMLGEGLGQPLMLAPGDARLFGFHLARPGLVGVGVQATPDVVTSRLLNDQGQTVGEGVVQMPRLAAGNYVLEVTAPATGSPVQIRPALVGVAPPPAGPPPEVRQQFRAWLNARNPPSKKQ